MILGRLGNDPEVRTTQNGTVVASLSIATNDGIGENITTEWHRVVVFGKSAEAIQKYTSKGSQLFVEGRLRTNKWQDKNGNTQYTTERLSQTDLSLSVVIARAETTKVVQTILTMVVTISSQITIISISNLL